MMLLRSVILRHNLSLWVTLAITVAYTACLYSAQTPTQPPTPASRPPGYAEVPAVHASDAQQLVEPFNPALHSIFIIGDSTAAYHIDRMKEGYAEAQGWGVFFYAFFDPSKVNVVNLSRGGRSTRTYLTEGLWDKAIAQFKPGDVVLLQLGQNDIFALNDQVARGTIPDIGDETQEIDNIATHKHETVHTFGWYLRKFIRDTEATGAQPIVMSLTTRNVWKDGHIEVGVNNYREISWKIAQQEGRVDFVDVSALVAEQYEKLGQEKTFGMFHTREPVHLDIPGAFMNARCIVAGLKGLPDAPVSSYLSYLGLMVEAETPPAVPSEWAQDLTHVTPVAPKTPADSATIAPASATPVPAPAPAASISPSAAARGEIYPPPHATRIVLAGDSTVNHTTGWGTAFCERQATDTECFNSSRNGRSAKSYREQGLWDRALAIHPDYILIQFGANDGPGKGPLLADVPATTFSDTMRDDIREARAMGAIPVLVTPLPQRNYMDGKHVRTLEDYAAAMRAVGKETGAAVLDLNAEANDALDAMTEEQAHQFNSNPADPSVPGRDTTHLNAKGGEFFGAMVAREFAAAFTTVKVNTR
jgi:lysophospholipase L1-like esterase